MYMYYVQDQGSKALFGGAMTDSEEEGISDNFRLIMLSYCLLVDDFIVDEMGRPINRKKGRDQSTDMLV